MIQKATKRNKFLVNYLNKLQYLINIKITTQNNLEVGGFYKTLLYVLLSKHLFLNLLKKIKDD